jgi:malate dehydrogenase (oxaloacetate-decarboxylating)
VLPGDGPIIYRPFSRVIDLAQTKQVNAYVFPGIGLGSISVQARRISDGMLMAAARALAEASPSKRDRNANLLPPVIQLREVSYRVAIAIALQAQAEGLAEETSRNELDPRVRAKMWTPMYRPYRCSFD